MMESPFTFPDGDQFPTCLSKTAAGSVRFSDRGRTLMNMSCDHDVDPIHEGAHALLREQVVRESGIEVDSGIFPSKRRRTRWRGGVIKFGQALTKIHDLTLPIRERVASSRRLPKRTVLGE